MVNFHHAHLMAADADASVEFYRRWLGAEVVADLTLSGSRNLFLQAGTGKLHLYDQPPNHRGPVNHLGFSVRNLAALVEAMAAAGVATRGVRETDLFRYAMVEGPDGVLLELFEFDRDATPPELHTFLDVG